MATYFVTRHAGAVEWGHRRGIEAIAVGHVDLSRIGAGDVVLGTLPVHLAAEIRARGARYLHLKLELPETARGRELSADDMERFGACLIEYHVARAAGRSMST